MSVPPIRARTEGLVKITPTVSPVSALLDTQGSNVKQVQLIHCYKLEHRSLFHLLFHMNPLQHIKSSCSIGVCIPVGPTVTFLCRFL